jgi:hypothetical protein
MKFAQIVFVIAGVSGVIATLPLYFLENQLSLQNPPAITHLEFYYGFVGVVLAWQILFLIVSRHPERYVAIMPAACVEKFSYAFLAIILFAQNRLSPFFFFAGLMDLTFGILFVICYLKLRRATVV